MRNAGVVPSRLGGMRASAAVVRRILVAVLLIGVTACGTTSEGRHVPPQCEFPDGARLTFVGETTMAELGVPAPGRERDPVYAWVSADAIWHTQAGLERVACIERGFRQYERSVFPGALLRTPPPGF